MVHILVFLVGVLEVVALRERRVGLGRAGLAVCFLGGEFAVALVGARHERVGGHPGFGELWETVLAAGVDVDG